MSGDVNKKAARGKKKATKKAPKKPAANVGLETPEFMEPAESDPLEIIGVIEIPPAFVGDTIEGNIYETHHECPVCHAIVQTVGAGHPELKCSRCRMVMRTTSEIVEMDDDR